MNDNIGTNSDFNEVPSWYQETVATPPPPPAPHFAGNAAPIDAHQQGFPGDNAPKKKGFGGGAVKLGIGAVLIGGGWIASLGTTSADALDVGDCFILGEAEEIDRVDTPDCSEAHDSQVVGLVEVASNGPYPGFIDPYWDEVFAECESQAALTITDGDALPADIQLEILTPLEDGWDRGDRGSICVIFSPSGLQRSFTETPS